MRQEKKSQHLTIFIISGETHSIWNPASEIDALNEDDDEEEDEDVGKEETPTEEEDRFMFFSEIAQEVAPVLDRLFPEGSGVRLIGEPGRYFVAASATLCCSVVSARSNELDTSFVPEAIDDKKAAEALDAMTPREETEELVHHERKHSTSLSMNSAGLNDAVLTTISEELADYSKLFASQQLAQQEIDVYNDGLDLYNEDIDTAADLLGPPDEKQAKNQLHTVEGMSYPLVSASGGIPEDAGTEDPNASALLTLAAAGEAAVNGFVMQAVADSAPLQDDFAYYINDGVYGAFNNIMFDHAQIRPRILQTQKDKEKADKVTVSQQGSFQKLDSFSDSSQEGSGSSKERAKLFASTVFGPTCDSIDVIARSVLLPKLQVGDWMYFQNMGAYTMAAASAFNGFTPSEKMYVCSVQPEHFEDLIKGPEEEIEHMAELSEEAASSEEKKDAQ